MQLQPFVLSSTPRMEAAFEAALEAAARTEEIAEAHVGDHMDATAETGPGFVDVVVPNFRDRARFSEYAAERSHNIDIVARVQNLLEDYPFWRRIRGDGNCFYRSVAVGALEFGIRSPGAGLPFLTHLRDTIANASLEESALSCHQSPCVAFLDSVLADCATLPGCEEVSFAGATHALSNEICHRLLHGSCDRDLVASFRALASCFLRDDAADMSAWLSMPVEDYCLTVDSMGTDAEGLAIHALSQALSIRLRIVYLHRDRDLGHYSYPADNEDPCHVHLLLSPGHYDLLYPALPTAWGGSGFVPRPVDAGIAAAPAPWVAPRTGESPAQCAPLALVPCLCLLV